MQPLDRPLDEVEAAARSSGRHLLLFLWAPWSGPSALMERAFAEPDLVAAAAGFADILRVDADAHPAVMQRFALRSVPGVVLLGSESHVIAGPLPAAQLRDWLAAVKAGRSADVAPEWNVEARRRALESHVSGGQSERVLAELDWFWSEAASGAYRQERFMPSFMNLLAQAIRASPVVRAHFLKLRNASVPGFTNQNPGFQDWLALNDALGQTQATLDWFDARLAKGAVPVLPLTRMRRAVLERGRAADLLALSPLPLGEVQDAIDLFASVPFPPGFQEFQRAELRVETALLLRACEAGRPEAAEAVKAAILAFDDSDETRRVLALPFEELARLDASASFKVE